MVNIVIINGVGGVGKSEFCKQSQEYSKKRWKNVVVYEVSTVDFVKLVAVYAGWNGEKDEKGRKLLYDIKEALYNRKSKTHTKVNSIYPAKSDIKNLNARKIISQQKETLAILKQYGLRTTKHKHNRYSITSTDAKRVEEALLKDFPNLYVILSETPNGTQLIKIYNKQYDLLLMQVEITDK